MTKNIIFLTALALLTLIPVNNTAFATSVRNPIILINVGYQGMLNDMLYCSDIYKKFTVESAVINQSTNVQEMARQSPQVSRGNSGVARQVLAISQSLLGKNYKYGANGPNAFDCSGFTKYAYQQGAGMNLPHQASNQIKYGNRINKREELLAGDLVFFSYYNNGGIKHVGIYIGNGRFIHASSKKGVTINALSDQYYSSNYKGATRLIQ